MFYLTDYEHFNYNKEDVHEESQDKTPSENEKNDKNQKKECILLNYLCELLDKYCKFGSLHGLRYIRDSSITRIERLFWLGTFLSCLYMSGIVVRDAYLTGVTNKFQLVLSPATKSIWEIPFPAVLVCSTYPIRRSVFDLEKELNNLKFRHFSKMVCSNKMAFGSNIFNATIDDEFFEFISNGAIPCQDLIVNCHWRRTKMDCCTLFKPIITQFGLCYVFNNLPGEVMYKDYTPPPGVEDIYDDDLMLWDIESGYPNRGGGRTKRVRPYRVEHAGQASGFTFDLIDVREEWQEICTGPYTGFQLYMYPPYGVVEPDTAIRIPYNAHTNIKLNPSFISSEEDLRGVDIGERACLFKDEFQLEYFNHYSQSACQIECFTNMSLRQCGCVPFFVQRFVGVFSYPYCNDYSNTCLWSVYDNITRSSMSGYKNKLSVLNECVCIPGCSLLQYDFQTNFQKISDVNTIVPRPSGYNKTSQDNIARLSVFFAHQVFHSIKRINTSDLGNNLGNCGGLLGLLFGFSFMSLFEVIYFAIVWPMRKVVTLLVFKCKK